MLREEIMYSHDDNDGAAYYLMKSFCGRNYGFSYERDMA
jgi:hypothetical protein